MSENVNGELTPLEVRTSDNGREVLWAEVAADRIRVVSVPVFAYGVSRGSLVAAVPGDRTLLFTKTVFDSRGATLRAYVAGALKASSVYLNTIVPEAKEAHLQIGPATFFDPEIAAIHVASRGELPKVATYFDDLVRRGLLRFWEYGDPVNSAEEPDEEAHAPDPWELVHPLPVDGNSSVGMS